MSYKEIWEQDLSPAQIHATLYSKNHYERNDPVEDIRTIYAMNSGGVVTSNQYLVMNCLHPALLKIIGPIEFSRRAGKFLCKLEAPSPALSSHDNIIEAYLSELAVTTTNPSERPGWLPDERSLPFLENETAKVIGIDGRDTIYPRGYDEMEEEEKESFEVVEM